MRLREREEREREREKERERERERERGEGSLRDTPDWPPLIEVSPGNNEGAEDGFQGSCTRDSPAIAY